MIEYTGEGHKRINGWLRRGGMPADPWAAARVRDLDAVLAKNPMQSETVLVRTVDLDAFRLAGGGDLARVVGVVRVERGYLSTTMYADGGRTKAYADPVRLIVRLPAGTPAAAVGELSVAGQGEVLLGRGLRYVLSDPAYDPGIGMWVVVMEIV
ncbi:hypothetical protein GCM10023147_14760 [Tsukamurella soli]|uniref:ADP ribosyltransferase domain-containing protein n=1 Tax=Tsukamurella soli TaxID=644556 RepID=A0ABP8JCS9_9ACTN